MHDTGGIMRMGLDYFFLGPLLARATMLGICAGIVFG